MSAEGHSLPIRLVSASRDVASSPKADTRFQRRICRGPLATDAPQQTASLFDHLVSAGEQRLRDAEAERPGNLVNLFAGALT